MKVGKGMETCHSHRTKRPWRHQQTAHWQRIEGSLTMHLLKSVPRLTATGASMFQRCSDVGLVGCELGSEFRPTWTSHGICGNNFTCNPSTSESLRRMRLRWGETKKDPNCCLLQKILCGGLPQHSYWPLPKLNRLEKMTSAHLAMALTESMTKWIRLVGGFTYVLLWNCLSLSVACTTFQLLAFTNTASML